MTEALCRWRGAARLLLRLHPTYAGQLGVVRAASNNPTQSDSSTKPPLKKPKTPQGRFDETEETTKEREPLERFPDDTNPITKEKGGPRGPEPTRYGDWERKGRCIDF
ncbi:succinate dehydrogenase assembly factor 4, mitochondrial [Bufo gargarizans]|uniref:succinate dehydrogenase assembly factor 4, mitochondrial n=1 Tax=Bufo gargarizans TaxID=30331 RepID=UPI001CF530AD|nr:succinate dehydrogenase assembly factor 4, mitochondrial [Bufo gargarizans]